MNFLVNFIDWLSALKNDRNCKIYLYELGSSLNHDEFVFELRIHCPPDKNFHLEITTDKEFIITEYKVSEIIDVIKRG